MSRYEQIIIDGVLYLTWTLIDLWDMDDERIDMPLTIALPLPTPGDDPLDACYDRAHALAALGWSRAYILWALDIYNRVACQGALPLSTLSFIVLFCKEEYTDHDHIFSTLPTMLTHLFTVEEMGVVCPQCGRARISDGV